LHEWVERIVEDYITDQAIEDQTSLDTVKEKFYTDLHEGFLCTIPRLLHKFMLDKGVSDIVEYRPRLRIPLPNSNLEEKDEKWEEFLEAKCKDTKEAWDYFLSQ
jgi:hypothetical protein